jgi:hypothetical protein
MWGSSAFVYPKPALMQFPVPGMPARRWQGFTGLWLVFIPARRWQTFPVRHRNSVCWNSTALSRLKLHFLTIHILSIPARLPKATRMPPESLPYGIPDDLGRLSGIIRQPSKDPQLFCSYTGKTERHNPFRKIDTLVCPYKRPQPSIQKTCN